MSHTPPTIPAALRERLGTRYARRVRQTGQLPAVIYGHGTAPTSVSVDAKQLTIALKKNQHVVVLALEGGTAETCLVKDLQFGYLGDNLIHADFTRVNLDEVVTVKVHIHWAGEAVAAKKAGCVLMHDQSELEVRCRVLDIPESIRADLTAIMPGTLLHASEIPLPAGVTATHPQLIVARVTEIHEQAAAEAAAPGATTEPEVITAKKPEAEGDAAKPDGKKA